MLLQPVAPQEPPVTHAAEQQIPFGPQALLLHWLFDVHTPPGPTPPPTHWLPWHISFDWHTWPHVPQLLRSVAVSTHTPPQMANGAEHGWQKPLEQMPEQHMDAVLHIVPAPEQLPLVQAPSTQV